MTLYKWSQTSASDATADWTINWQEGQAPSTVNDRPRHDGRDRKIPRRHRRRDRYKWHIDRLRRFVLSGIRYAGASGRPDIAFTPHITNGATVTLNVDAGARPLRTSPGVELLAGTIIQGTPYVATYNNGDSAFYLQSFYGNPYNIPLGGGLDFWGSTTPNSSFAFPSGRPFHARPIPRYSR